MANAHAFGSCPTCGEFCYLETHRCKPIFLCAEKGAEDATWGNIRARDAAEAAEKYAERADHYSGECDEDGRDILVRTPEQAEDQAELYRVDVDISPTYTAHLVDAGNEQPEEDA